MPINVITDNVRVGLKKYVWSGARISFFELMTGPLGEIFEFWVFTQPKLLKLTKSFQKKLVILVTVSSSQSNLD